jgi:hypothetical protein
MGEVMFRSIFAVGMVLLSTATFAATLPLRATLTTASKDKYPVAGAIIWQCNGVNCYSISDISGTSDASACYALVKALGPVAKFSSEKGSFDDANLERCNRAAKR